MAKQLLTSLREAPSTSETWVINESPDLDTLDCTINFISNNINHSRIYTDTEERSGITIGYLNYQPSSAINPIPTPGKYAVYYIAYKLINGGTWVDTAYRTVTFETPPTGDLLTWLQANAVKQTSLNEQKQYIVCSGTNALARETSTNN